MCWPFVDDEFSHLGESGLFSADLDELTKVGKKIHYEEYKIGVRDAFTRFKRLEKKKVKKLPGGH